MKESADTVGTLQTFKTVADNPLTRNILKILSKDCPKDGCSHLEIALELYVGVRENACFKCRFSKRIISPILNVASKAFGLTETQLKEKFRDPYWRRGLLSVIKGIAWFGVRHPYVPGAPFQVVWNITRACNLKCLHCYENAGLRGKDELTTEEALKGIDILADAGVLILAFSGGEPTIRPDILRLIERASGRGMYPAIATNAIVFASREKVKDFKKAGLQFVQISLDGLNPETHDKFRGVPGAFEKTVQGIKNCVAEELFVEIATTATRFNYKEIPAMIEFAEKLGVNWFMLYNFVPTGRGVDIIESDLTPDEREDILKICWNKMKTSGIEVLSTAPQFARIAQEIENQLVQIGEAGIIATGLCSGADATVIPTHFYNPELPGQLKRLADFIGGCGAGRFYMAIEPNGDMFPCVFFPHEEAVKIGNLFKDDFEEVWRNSKLLWQIRDKDKLAENCKSCDFRYTCGGCRARAYNYFKDILAPDPGCILNMEFWHKIQRELKKNYFRKVTESGDILLQKM
jgi:radical SAM protein with 4Fe4S-binding SPASM domain